MVFPPRIHVARQDERQAQLDFVCRHQLTAVKQMLQSVICMAEDFVTAKPDRVASQPPQNRSQKGNMLQRQRRTDFDRHANVFLRLLPPGVVDHRHWLLAMRLFPKELEGVVKGRKSDAAGLFEGVADPQQQIGGLPFSLLVQVHHAPAQVGRNRSVRQHAAQLAAELGFTLTTDTVECQQLMRAVANRARRLGEDADGPVAIDEELRGPEMAVGSAEVSGAGRHRRSR
jgi:hypothetical protein